MRAVRFSIGGICGMKGNNIAVFAAGVFCALVGVAAGLWFSGLLVLGSSDAEAQGDPIVEAHAPDTPKPKVLPEDTTDLGKLKVMELAKYYHNVMMGRIKRDREDIRAAIAKLTQEDIDLMCDSFLKEPTGPGLTKYALVLSDVGTEKALRTLGSFYRRPDLKDSFDDYQTSLCLAETRSSIAKEILFNACRDLSQEELRKNVTLCLARFRDTDVSELFIGKIPMASEKEIPVLLIALGMVGLDDSVAYLKKIAIGAHPDLDEYRKNATNAFRRCPHAQTVDLVREIAFHADCQDEKLQRTCISVLGHWAEAGKSEAVEALCAEAVKEQKREDLFNRCIDKIMKLQDTDIKSKVLMQLLDELEDPRLKKVVSEKLERLG